jgi:hypothetical protein
VSLSRIATGRPRAASTLVLLLCVMLTACHSDSRATPVLPPELPLRPSQPGTSAADLGIQISPAVKPEFDLSIHDYVIDCTTNPDTGLTVADAGGIGFTYLGYTGHPDFQQPHQHGRFERTLTLAPGQRLRFVIAGSGSYSIRCLPADFPPLSSTRNGTPQAQWYLFSLVDYTIMTDSHGTPVWWLRQPGIGGVDAKVLGANQIGWSPAGDGTYVIRSFDGRILNTLSGNLDFHDIQLTATGTYLAFRYVPRVCPPDCADMSPWGGSTQAAVTDAQIVELDQNSSVLWSWSTRDHIALSETGDSGWYPAVAADIIHMNSIEPDGTDGLMFSARHLSAIYHITKSTGAVDWKIGGTHRPESLSVIGDIRPTAVGPNGQALSGPHDVRKWSDGTISIHDNGTLVGRPPSVLRYRVDPVNRTAEVVEDIHDARASQALCCGSARLLPGGNWLVQWGATPYLTELDPAGNPVLTIQYNRGSTFSYRAVPVLRGTVAPDTVRNGMDAISRE